MTANITLSGINIEANSSKTAPGDTAIAVEGSGTVCIDLDGNNTVVSGRDHAGIENNSTALIIQDENDVKGSLTATGGNNGAGIGGGSGYNGSVTATEFYGTAKNISVSGNAQLTVMKGDVHHSLWDNKCGYGAWIGEGGGYVDNNARDGLEIEPDISRLYTDGYVRYFGYRTIFGTYIPPEPAEPIWGTPENTPYFPLRVIDANGVELVFTHETDNGVLTVTTEHGFAILTGSIGNLNTLSDSGVKTIVFTTTYKTTSIDLEALKNAGLCNDIFRLTHDAANAALTVGGKEADGIIK